MTRANVEADRLALLKSLKGATKPQLVEIAARAMAELVAAQAERDRLKAWQEGVLPHLENVETFLQVEQPEMIRVAVEHAVLKVVPEMVALEKRRGASKAAAARLKRDSDGRQAAKAAVRECWQAWQADPDTCPSKAEFARRMLKQFPALESSAVIGRWCAKWERETDQLHK